MLLHLLGEAFSQALLPASYRESHDLEQDLRLIYTKIHVCLIDCILYRNEHGDKEDVMCRVGYPANPTISDAFPKGFRTFPIETKATEIVYVTNNNS